MKAHRLPDLIRKVAFGLAAVVAPAAVMFVALGFTWSTGLSGFAFYIAIFCVALAVMAWLARACVRVAHFSPRVAVVLTTLPLSILTLLTTLPLLAGQSPGTQSILPLLFWLVQLVIAMNVAAPWNSSVPLLTGGCLPQANAILIGIAERKGYVPGPLKLP